LEVRQVRGRVVSAVGPWPRDVRALFELRQTAGGAVRRVEADSEGRFKVDGVRPGEYCFAASAIGWDPVIGNVLVNKTASAKARIELVLPLAQ
jgi:hypothetical protein